MRSLIAVNYLRDAAPWTPDLTRQGASPAFSGSRKGCRHFFWGKSGLFFITLRVGPRQGKRLAGSNLASGGGVTEIIDCNQRSHLTTVGGRILFKYVIYIQLDFRRKCEKRQQAISANFIYIKKNKEVFENPT